MSESQQLVAADVAIAYPVGRHRRWLDIGGGDGTFLAALGASAPRLTGTLVDVPAVAALATRRFAAAGLTERFAAIGRVALVEPLPHGYDAVSFVRVLHDHDDGPALALLRAAVAALAPGGSLLVVEPLASERRSDPIAEAYFGWYFTALGQGRLRTRRELFGLLAEAGLERAHVHRNRQPLVVRVIAARRPNSKHRLTTNGVSVE
jgi:demethylspheroidene O-methyltransferase